MNPAGLAGLDPGVDGQIALAEVEGGIKISVPMFVNTGDLLRIDTETGEYVERVMK